MVLAKRLNLSHIIDIRLTLVHGEGRPVIVVMDDFTLRVGLIADAIQVLVNAVAINEIATTRLSPR